MQRLTNEMIGVKIPLSKLDSEDYRIRLSALGFIDPSIILKTDNTVMVSRKKNIYTISTNLSIDNEKNIVTDDSTIILHKDNHGIQEILVNVDTVDDPGYAEITDYTVVERVITLDTDEYNGKDTFVKYLTHK